MALLKLFITILTRLHVLSAAPAITGALLAPRIRMKTALVVLMITSCSHLPLLVICSVQQGTMEIQIQMYVLYATLIVALAQEPHTLSARLVNQAIIFNHPHLRQVASLPVLKPFTTLIPARTPAQVIIISTQSLIHLELPNQTVMQPAINALEDQVQVAQPAPDHYISISLNVLPLQPAPVLLDIIRTSPLIFAHVILFSFICINLTLFSLPRKLLHLLWRTT